MKLLCKQLIPWRKPCTSITSCSERWPIRRSAQVVRPFTSHARIGPTRSGSAVPSERRDSISPGSWVDNDLLTLECEHAQLPSSVVTGDTGIEDGAIAAAQAVARQWGVACDEAEPLSGGSNVLVHLKPAPVVARVMTGTSMLHDDTERWLSREVAVAVFLAQRTDAVAAPSDLLPPGPHERDGLWMTMWNFVAHDPQAALPQAAALGRSLRDLHAALADFRGDLDPVSEIRDWLARLLAELRPSSSMTYEDIEWLRFKLDALTPAVFESSLRAQPLHGDVAISNLLSTGHGLVWNDLEDVCVGPVAWDVAGLVSSARARGQTEAFVEELLAAYGGPGVEDLAAFLQAHTLYEVIWQASAGPDRPHAMKRAAASLARLRATSEVI